MALDMTPEEKAKGEANFHRTVGGLVEHDNKQQIAAGAVGGGAGVTRRRFMQGMLAAGAGVLPMAAGVYFGYSNSGFRGNPVKAGLIGAGDEGGVLVGEHNPAYLEFIAYSDIRPYNQRRIFRGEDRGPRRGFNRFRDHYGNNPQSSIELYENWHDLLDNPEIEAVVIALPLHLHATVAIEAMRKGKHVLCEKLMAWNIRECKEMIRVSEETGKLLAIGHQRHYSMLYAHSVGVIDSGMLGEIRHIRAQWHRNQARPNSAHRADDPNSRGPYLDSWRPAIPAEDDNAPLLQGPNLHQYGFRDINELVRWRLYNRTGGGLMAELGSHQLDACSIFLSSANQDGSRNSVRPIAVTAVGGKHFYTDDRDVDDHVYCIYEFPGKNYHPTNNPNDRVVVTYSSINTNGFEPYGECVMGTTGTLVVSEEKTAMLWGLSGRSTEVAVNTSGAAPALDSTGSPPSGGTQQRLGQDALGTADPSRGYREEMEHLAFIIRNRGEGMERDQQRPEMKLRCDGRKAMADAIMALVANQAMHPTPDAPTERRIEFQDAWYDHTSDAVPDENRVADPFLQRANG